MLKKIHYDNLIILKNLSFLSILRFVNVGVKFLLVAYLVRVLGNINYGSFAFKFKTKTNGNVSKGNRKIE